MDPKTRKLGGSLKVPCVQELAKEKPSSVPTRYVRPDKHQYPTFSNGGSSHQIPVVDMESLLSSAEEESALEVQKLHSACKDWGFFQLINHGVSSSLVEKLKSEIQEFFKLPKEEKERYYQEAGDIEGYGQVFVKSEEQKLDWADMFYMITQPENLRKAHLFPKLPLSLRESLEEYSIQLKSLALKLVNQMAKALGIHNEEIGLLFEEGLQSMRLNYYPPCPQPELVTGLCHHSDPVGVTILLQINEVEGLQIKNNEAWIPVLPLPNAFVVNVGDIFEIITNGAYKSVEHQAIVNSQKERLSIATFTFPNLERDIEPAPSLISPENPAKFRRAHMMDYLKGLYSRELDKKSYLDTIRI